jgi:hypothetical protein
MQVLESNKNGSVPSPLAKAREETIPKVSSENKKVSFRDREARDLTGVSRLPYMAKGLSGCQNPNQAPFQNAHLHQVRSEMERHNELLYQSWDQIRAQARDLLTMLIRFDTNIGIEDSRILCDAVNIIHRAETAS